MSLSFRTLAISLAVFGVAMGVAFGAGVAYGRGSPKTVQSGLTQQQIQQLYGAPSGGGAAAGAGTAAGAAAGAGTGGASGATAAAARATSGRVTSVSGQTLTIETARGSQKVNLAASVTVSKAASGSAADLTAGTTIFASGTRNADGSFDATSVSQVPNELQTLITALMGNGTGTSTTPAAATPAR